MRLSFGRGPGRNIEDKCTEAAQASPGQSGPLLLRTQHPVGRPVRPPKPSAKGLQLSPRSGVGGWARPARMRRGRIWTSAQTPAWLLKETEAEGAVGTPPGRRWRHLYPPGLPATSRRPPSPGPRRSRAAWPEAGRRKPPSPRAALTWLAAWSAGRQQGAAQTQPRRHEQQPPRPHCPRLGALRRPSRLPGLELRALPPPARSSRGRCGAGGRQNARRG